MCIVLTTKRQGSFNPIWHPVTAETAVNSRGHYCSSVEKQQSCRRQPFAVPSSSSGWLLLEHFFPQHSESSDSSHSPCVYVHNTFQSDLFFFFIPTFVVHLLGWDCRLGSAACNTYFSHFSVVIECSTDFCSFLLICYCSTPCLPLYLLFCVGSLLYTSFWAEARDWFSPIILNRSRNRHMQYTGKPQCQCYKLIVINSVILSNMLHAWSRIVKNFTQDVISRISRHFPLHWQQLGQKKQILMIWKICFSSINKKDHFKHHKSVSKSSWQMAFQSKNSAVGDDYNVWKYMKNLCLMYKIY